MTPAAFESTFVACVMVGMFFTMAKGWYSPEVVMFVSLLLVWNFGILSNAEALSGFNNPGILVVGALYIVVSAIEKSTLADQAARRILGLTTTFNIGFSRLMICALCMSAFTNNTPVTALLIPIVQDWARTRGFDPAVLLMPLSFVCAFGGILTTVGGGTNLLIQGMLFEAGKSDEKIQSFELFDPAYVGLPLALVGIIYLLFAAPRILGTSRDVGGSRRPARGCSEDLLTEVEVTEDFDLLGRPFSLTLAVLGLSGQALLKVRRSVVDREMSTPITRTTDAFDVSDGPGRVIEGSDGLTWARRLGEKAFATAEVAKLTVMSSVSHLLSRRILGKGPLGWTRRPWYHEMRGEEDENVTEKESNDTVPCVEMAAVQVDEGTSTTSGVRLRSTSLNEATTTDVIVCGRMQKEGSDDEGANAVENMYEIPPGTTVRAGDVLVIGCDEEAMVRLLGSLVRGGREGLKVLGVSAPELPRHGKVFSKLVLSRSSKFLGRVARLDNAYFGASFECSVVSFRLKGDVGGGVDLMGYSARDCPGNSSFDHRSSDRSLHSLGGSGASAESFQGDGKALFVDEDDAPTPLLSASVGRETEVMGVESQREKVFAARRRRGEEFEPGDTVLVLASQDFLERASATRDDFLCSEEVGRLPEPMGWFHFFPLVVFSSMLAWNLAAGVGMARASFAACAMLILVGWVDAPRAVGCVNWRLLVLMGSALGFSKAIAKSGLADQAGEAIRESGMSPSTSLFVLCGFTMMCTELISNNAAAALNIPVALSMARELKVDYRPFAMTVLVSASCAFLTPIGTPTNVMVWGPGGYKFGEYAKLGGPLSLLFWVVASVAIPLVFPF